MLAGAGACNSSSSSTRFYVPPPDKGAVQQMVSLVKKHDFKDAVLLAKMVSKGHAVWLNGGTPTDVKKQVKQTMVLAKVQHAVPVFSVYNIPGRDCAGYSQGGALNATDYANWIDGVAQGLGTGKAWIILETDSLGLLPQTNCGSTQFTDADRYAELNAAVDRLKQDPNAKVYLDGTHSAWQNVGQAASRLVQAGVLKADGFFLNVSNYQYTANSIEYGTWISDCITYATSVSVGNFGACPDQYWNGGPPTWVGTALSPYGEWSDTATEADLNTSGENTRYAGMLGTTAPTTHFMIDTGRNGLGPWNWAVAGYSDAGTAQDWCNAPGRGNGITPTTNTGNSLVDAFLWVKVPGESDGSCTRGTTGPTDPEWGITDPAAGQWYPQQALQLTQLANPALN